MSQTRAGARGDATVVSRTVATESSEFERWNPEDAEVILRQLAQAFFQTGPSVSRRTDGPAPRVATRVRPGGEIVAADAQPTALDVDAVMAVDQAGTVLSANPAMAAMLGAEMSSLAGAPVGRVLLAEGLQQSATTVERLLREGGQFLGRRRDGSTFPANVTSSPLVLAGETTSILVVHDLSERREAEEKRRRAETRYRTLVEQIPAVTFMASLEGGENEVYIGPQIESLLGFTQKEWLDDPVLWFRQMHPDDQERWNAEFARGCATGGPFRADCRFYSRNGRTVWVHGEARIVRADDGRPLFVQGIAFDISDIKEAEQKMREAQEVLVRTEKLAAIGQLAAGVAHELRNPLSAVRNAWYYIEKKMRASGFVETDKNLAQFSEIIPSELGRCAKIIGDLLDFSRNRPLYRTAMPVRDLVRAACAIVVKPAKTIEISEEIPDGLPVPNLDVEQFRQVLVNLVQNAAEAVSPQTGVVKIRAAAQTNGVSFEVSDNGRGISAEVQAKMFEPLFTTKLRGTGLGLSVVEGIVKRHGGTISVKSSPGQGTAFTIVVPVGEHSVGPTPEQGGAADLR